ncbi:MAG TPA: type VI secretion system protein TssA, partial [Pyrinomonadaceae bacterium]
MSAVVEAPPSAAPAIAAAEVINVEALLAPIPGENPAGESLQYSGLYDEIREARRSEDNLEQGEWKRETKVPDWGRVFELASSAIETKTKDLQVCAWLDEALVKLHGFAGLREGLKLMRGLHERFWEQVYPEIDEGDLEARANALSWMDRQVAAAVREAPLTKSPAYGYLQWEDSKNFDIPENLESLDPEQQARAEEARARAAQQGRITSEDWRKAKSASRRAFYEELYALLNECWTEFEALDRQMDERYQQQTPGLGELKKSLDEVRSFAEKIVKEKRLLEPDPLTPTDGAGEGVTAGGDGNVAAGGGSAAVSTGPVRSRQEALRRLGEVAEFFRRTEPHSPVSYLVQRAIK